MVIRYSWVMLLLTITSFWSLSYSQDYTKKKDPHSKGTLPTDIPNYNNRDDKDTVQDTTKKEKRERKPLESFYFDDSTRMTRIFAWRVSLLNNDIERVLVDTLQDNFQLDYSFMRDGVGAAYLGNIGSAVIPLNYFKRTQPQNFSFVNVWRPYILTPEQAVFYNAKIPYSRLSYSMSGEKPIAENLFNFILSHNISPSTSANINYNAVETQGMYANQRTLVRDFSINIAHTGKRYAVHGGYIYNHGNVNENGGIRDDRDITDTIFDIPKNIPVYLTAAKNEYRGHTFWVTQSYGIPLRAQREDELTIQKIPTIFVGQSAEITTFKKNYIANRDTALFKTWYIDEGKTHDSIAQSVVDLRFFAQLQPYNRDGLLGIVTGGVGNETDNYYMYVPQEYQAKYGQGGNMGRNSTYVYGQAEGALKKYLKWNATAQVYLLGYRSGDFTFDGNIKLTAFIKGQPLSLDGGVRFSLREPDFWAQTFFSNHFAWNNSFVKESATTINARISMPSIGFEVGADYQIVQNKVYYDQNSLPAQFSGSLSVLGIYLQKNFRLGGLHLNHRVLMQLSSDQIVAPTPTFSAYLSYFYRLTVVKNVLDVDLGIDGRYNTKYYGFGYNPALSQFYNQREKEIGGYPYLDAFVSAKWKRMRILVKLQHFNANLLEDKNYFMILHHPANRLMFKFGISWSFYD